MYSGEKLAEAIRTALKQKGAKQADLARFFKVRPQSVGGWLKHGRVAKEHLDKLIIYFSDVVPPSHFGIESLELSNNIITNQSNISNNSNQTNISGNQNNNSGGGAQYNIQIPPISVCENSESEKDIRANVLDNLIRAMPLLDIDQAVTYAMSSTPAAIEMQGSVKVATFIPHSGRTFGLKMPDDSMLTKEIDSEAIFKNDLLIIEPMIEPRDGDLVLVALENNGQKRGIIARLELDVFGNRQLIQTGKGKLTAAMPEDAVICGVVTEIKRRLVSCDVLESRLQAFESSK